MARAGHGAGGTWRGPPAGGAATPSAGGPCRRRWLPAGEPLEDVAELPGRLDQAGAVVPGGGAGAAAVVALQCPERQLGQAAGPGPPQDGVGVVEGEDLR